ANIKVRQPLSHIMIPSTNAELETNLKAVENLIKAEVNVKEIKLVDNSAGILVKRIKPDFKKLGPKCGKDMKQVAQLLQNMSQTDITKFEDEGQFEYTINDALICILTDDVEIISEDIPGWLVANEGKLTIALDITLTDDLISEGIAREAINRIQNLRKSTGLEITDKIEIKIQSDKNLDSAIEKHKSYIASQVLATSIEIVSELPNGQAIEMDDNKIILDIKKV
ncbi:MAG TPA: DUF5915 domain-containing protein, partial [Candidatus Enterocola sp.]|nr:DUF5915 domain-containing protein [Candidatus Enterocola sp.]